MCAEGEGRDIEGPARPVYHTDEIAAMLGITEQHTRKLLREGKLLGRRIGGTWYINREYFDALVRCGLDYGGRAAGALLPLALTVYELAQRAWPWLDQLLPG